MIAGCAHCGERIRDCTGFRRRRAGGLEISVPVTDWYHTATGHERCEGMSTLAAPRPLVSVRCPAHRKLDESCQLCLAAGDVSLYFHNNGRCIPARCYWPHERASHHGP